MYPRTEYEMTDADKAELLAAMKPVAAMMIGGTVPRSQQENANDAWARLGKKMGFDAMTVRPIPGKGDRFFTAVPSETEEVRAERLAREAEEKRAAEIKLIDSEITRLEERRAILAKGGSDAE